MSTLSKIGSSRSMSPCPRENMLLANVFASSCPTLWGGKALATESILGRFNVLPVLCAWRSRARASRKCRGRRTARDACAGGSTSRSLAFAVRPGRTRAGRRPSAPGRREPSAAASAAPSSRVSPSASRRTGCPCQVPWWSARCSRRRPPSRRWSRNPRVRRDGTRSYPGEPPEEWRACDELPVVLAQGLRDAETVHHRLARLREDLAPEWLEDGGHLV